MNIFETKSFRFSISHGWNAVKVNERAVQVCKGGESAADILRYPYFQLNFSGDAYMLPPSKSGYYDVIDIEPLTLGKYTWRGFECDSMGFRVAMLWTGEGKGQFQMSANLETPQGKMEVTDGEITEMLASISVI